MKKLSFRGMRLEKSKCAKEPTKRKHINILATFGEKGKETEFYWYPTYKELRCLIHCLAALHGEKEVVSRVLDNLEFRGKEIVSRLLGEEGTISEILDKGLIEIYNKQIGRITDEIHSS